MDIRYEEWLPGSAGLAELVTAYWRVSGDGSNVPSSGVLRDGHVELVFNLGDPVGLVGPAYTGDQPDRAVAGPLSKALRLEYHGTVNTFGIRFHPARGAGFLGKFATELTDQLLPLSQVCAPLDRALKQLLRDHPTPDTEFYRAALDQVLLRQLASALPSDTPVIAVAGRLMRSDDMPLVEQIAGRVRNLVPAVATTLPRGRRRTPKRCVRVLRFARVWQLASMRPRETWADLAAEHGYADSSPTRRPRRTTAYKPTNTRPRRSSSNSASQHPYRPTWCGRFGAFGAEPPTRVLTRDRGTQAVGRGYSLKNIEHIYLPKRTGEVATAGDSMVYYHAWRQQPQRDRDNWRTSPTLRLIRDYNQADCDSTWRLLEWLRMIQHESGIPTRSRALRCRIRCCHIAPRRPRQCLI